MPSHSVSPIVKGHSFAVLLQKSNTLSFCPSWNPDSLLASHISAILQKDLALGSPHFTNSYLCCFDLSTCCDPHRGPDTRHTRLSPDTLLPFWKYLYFFFVLVNPILSSLLKLSDSCSYFVSSTRWTNSSSCLRGFFSWAIHDFLNQIDCWHHKSSFTLQLSRWLYFLIEIWQATAQKCLWVNQVINQPLIDCNAIYRGT